MMKLDSVRRSVFLLCLALVVVTPLFSHIEGVEAATGDGSTVNEGIDVAGSGTAADAANTMAYTGLSAEEADAIANAMEKHEFQSDVSRLMGLIINSLYSNKEVFLREVISNASDALDKIRYLSLTDTSALDSGEELEIKIWVDEDTKTIHIRDTGVGMTKEDLIKNLGSIASSGTKRFVESIGGDSAADSNLIGQFGVGFYSVYLVADECTVTTKNNDDDQYIWQSGADANYSIAKDPRGNTLGRGTQLSLKLKEEAYEFLEDKTLRGLIERYSEFINFPIYLQVTTTEDEEVDLTEEELEAQAAERAAAAEAAKAQDDDDEEANEDDSEVDIDVSDDEEDWPTTKTVTVTKKDWELINSTKPIWTRPRSEITTDDYNDFYRSLTNTDEDPLAHIHFNAEGEVDFRSILYIPSKAPQEMFQSYGMKMRNIKLYVRRVFITDDFEDILPHYLAFVKGMVDSDNLPLNVSREMLQQHKMLKTIKKKLTRKVLEMVKKLAKNDDTYSDFWEEFGTAMKLGLIEDTANRTKLAKLLRFKSNKSDGDWVSLEAYVERMKKKQSTIYYLAGESVDQIENSPHLEILIKKGYECLYLTDPVDEYAIQSLPEFDGKKLVNVAKEGLFDEDEDEELEDEYADLLVWLKLELSDHVDKVVLSNRLYSSPSALVSSQYGYTANMERIVKAQAIQSNDPRNPYGGMGGKKKMEINPHHPLIKELNRLVSEDEDDPAVADLAQLLYETAAISSGYSLGADNTDFVRRVQRYMMMGLNLDPNAEVELDVADADDEVEDDVADEEFDEELFEEEDDDSTKDELFEEEDDDSTKDEL